MSPQLMGLAAVGDNSTLILFMSTVLYIITVACCLIVSFLPWLLSGRE